MPTIIAANDETTSAEAVLEQTAPRTITTTLYDLIAAVQETVGPEQDDLVVVAVWHMLRSGRATWNGDITLDAN